MHVRCMHCIQALLSRYFFATIAGLFSMSLPAMHICRQDYFWQFFLAKYIQLSQDEVCLSNNCQGILVWIRPGLWLGQQHVNIQYFELHFCTKQSLAGLLRLFSSGKRNMCLSLKPFAVSNSFSFTIVRYIFLSTPAKYKYPLHHDATADVFHYDGVFIQVSAFLLVLWIAVSPLEWPLDFRLLLIRFITH